MKKKNILQRFFSRTPKKWKQVRNTAAGLLTGIAALIGLPAVYPGIVTPQWFTDYSWYIVAILTTVMLYAQSKEEKK